jgi:hypothetical protein
MNQIHQLQKKIDKLEKELLHYRALFERGGNDARFSLAFKAPAQLAAVIKALYMFPIVGYDSLIAIADSHGHTKDHDHTYVRMMIYRTRRILEKHKIEIESRPLFGYSIDAKGKAKIKEMIGE